MSRGVRARVPAVWAVEAAAAIEHAGVGQQEAGAVVVARHRRARHDLEHGSNITWDPGINLCVPPTFRMLMQLTSCEISRVYGMHSEIIREPANHRLHHIVGYSLNVP